MFQGPVSSIADVTNWMPRLVRHDESAMTEPTRLILRRPDDWHVHLRDGAMLEAVAPYTARQFARGIVMPNLVPPITIAMSAVLLGELPPVLALVGGAVCLVGVGLSRRR